MHKANGSWTRSVEAGQGGERRRYGGCPSPRMRLPRAAHPVRSKCFQGAVAFATFLSELSPYLASGLQLFHLPQAYSAR